MQQSQEIPTIPSFLDTLESAQTSALLVDYDGTLAPFQIERDRAYPYPGVLPLLQKIQQSGKTSIIVITGRPIHEVQTLLHPLTGIEIWGAHGLDHLLANGTRQQVAIDSILEATLQQAEQWLSSNGMAKLTEVKPGGVAVHWRGLPEDRIQAVLSETLQGWTPLLKNQGLKLLHFEGGIELRITRPNKGDAVASVVKNLSPETPIAFLGDDITDEDGFRNLASRGLSILVRDEYRETEANAWIRPPQELISFLEQWLSRLAN